MKETELITIVCRSCKKSFYPYGKRKMFPPAYGTYKCPYCNEENGIIFDEELNREMARKKLGLDKKLETEVERLSMENKLLKQEVEWLKNQTAQNSANLENLAKYTDSEILDAKKEMAQKLAELMGKNIKNRTVKPI